MSNIKNVEALEKLTGRCAGFGPDYDPAQQNLRTNNLFAFLGIARSAMKEVGTAKTDFENATNAREVAFKDLDKLGVRILAELRSGGVMSQTISDANSMVRKLRTYGHANRKEVPVTKDAAVKKAPHKRIAKGLDYGTMAQSFEKLLQTIATVPGYAPTTPDLAFGVLNDRMQQLRAKNFSVVQAQASLSEARKKRDALFYSGDQSLYATAMAVKQQVKARFGASHPATIEISKIRFYKPRK